MQDPRTVTPHPVLVSLLRSRRPRRDQLQESARDTDFLLPWMLTSTRSITCIAIQVDATSP